MLVFQPLSSGCCSCFVDPCGLKPVIVRNDTEFDMGTYDIADAPAKQKTRQSGHMRGRENCGLFEFIVKWNFVQEDVWIAMSSVEFVLHISYALHRAIQVGIAGQDHKRCVCTVWSRWNARNSWHDGVVRPVIVRSTKVGRDIRQGGLLSVIFGSKTEDAVQHDL
jgi:hypothetical protein